MAQPRTMDKLSYPPLGTDGLRLLNFRSKFARNSSLLLQMNLISMENTFNILFSKGRTFLDLLSQKEVQVGVVEGGISSPCSLRFSS